MFRLLWLAMAGCGWLLAQESLHFATVSGRVLDPTGGAIENAAVTARQLDTNRTSDGRTDHAGLFRFSFLPVGRYEVRVKRNGFAEVVVPITLTVGAAFDLPITLPLGSTRTDLTVTADTALLEAARSQLAGTVNSAEVSNLPLLGRNYVDLALMIPGVSPTNTASTQLFAETSAVPGQGISIASQRNFSNSFIVDGLSANDDAAGLTGTFFGLDVVGEFQVVTSGGQAEFGRALGGYISMVTKSGTNQIHGDLYSFFRNRNLNAANALTGATLPLTQAQYGASVGGPLRRNRSFFFSNLEQKQLNQSGNVTISPANADAINARLLATGYSGSLVTTGLYPNPVHATNYLAKADHQWNTADQMSVRYSLYQVDSRNSRGAGALNSPSAAAALSALDQTIALSNVRTFSAYTVNETRGQLTRSNLDAPPNDAFGPAVSISGVATFGTLSGSPTARHNNLFEIADNLSHQQGPHALRFGADFLYNDLRIVYPQSARGNYSFASLNGFLNGTYNNSGFTQSFGNPVVSQTNPNVGMFAQDEWKVTRNLTLNVGLRYDLQFLQTIKADTDNISPRAGFAWSPSRGRRTVVRGSYGLFYDRVPLRALANALLSSGNTTDFSPATFVTVSLSPAQTGAPAFPYILPALPSGVLVNYTTMDPHLQNASSQQSSLEVEQQIGSHGTLSLAFQHLRGLHLIASINRNAPTCVASGSNNGCRPTAEFANNRQYSGAADSNYNGLHISFAQRPRPWGSFRISYAYSKALDDVGEFFFSAPIDNANIWKDYGRSDDDQRHRVTADAIANLPFGFHLSGTLQYYSSLPLNITTGATTVQGTTARPLLAGGDLLGRNTGRGFDLWNVNARLSRRFALGDRWHLETIAEAYNALNHRNDLLPNGTFGTGAYPITPLPSFGLPLAVADARSVQLALRISF